MLISFSFTTEAFLQGTKTVTRRKWTDRYFAQWLRAWGQGQLTHDAYDKSPRVGGRKVGKLILTHQPKKEMLSDFPAEDLLAEGGYWQTVDDYIAYQGGDPLAEVAVIRFARG
jgi:hypothetical protein